MILNSPLRANKVFSSCISSILIVALIFSISSYKQKVLDNENFAKDVGINATPSFLVFTEERLIRIIGAQQIETFDDVIQQLNR